MPAQHGPENVGVSRTLGQHVEPRLMRLWAKSDMSTRTPDKGMPLVCHLLDAAGVAGRLWDTWAPPSIRDMIAAAFDGDPDKARMFLMTTAGLHDIGKASPAFQYQVRSFHALLDEPLRSPLPPEPKGDMDDPEFRDKYFKYKARVHHTQVGLHALAEDILPYGFDNASGADTLAACVVGHHGEFRKLSRNGSLQAHELSYGFGTSHWNKVRAELVALVLREIGAPETYLDDLEGVKFPLSASVLSAGFTVMCDWIASSEDLIPLTHVSQWNDLVLGTSRGSEAVNSLELPPPWEPAVPSVSVEEFYNTRFSVPGSVMHPTHVQQQVVEEVFTSKEPAGLVLIEAATGSGKTEAALAAAEILAERHNRSGIVYVMPTRVTADAMYSRVRAWLSRTSHKGASLTLHHGTAAFNEEFALDLKKGRVVSTEPASSMFDSTNTCGDDDCGSAAEVHSWLASGGKRLLTSTVVGTVDSVLGACLDSKHVAVKHLGIASKVIVIDEVHASDEYMLQYLTRLLEWAGLYQVPVIALTATATPTLRRRLHSAYTRIQELNLPDTLSFPAITCSYKGSPNVTVMTPDIVEESSEDKEVKFTVARELCTPTQVADKAVELYTRGGVVCVVCNTVARAQEVYDLVRQTAGSKASLTHSRFTSHDRRAKDTGLLHTLGRDSSDRSPRIVVATQVVEQSLDVDFDVMISDAAPLDLLIQRAGRVHRHRRPSRPQGMEEPTVLVAGFTPDTKAMFHKGTGLYGSSVYPVWQGISAVSWIGDGRTFAPSIDTREVMRVLDGDAECVPEEWRGKWDESYNSSQIRTVKDENKAGIWLIGKPDSGEHYTLRSFPFCTGDRPVEADRSKGVRNNLITEDVIVLWNDNGAARLMPHVIPEAYRGVDLDVDFRTVRVPSKHWWAYRSAARSAVALSPQMVLGENSLWKVIRSDPNSKLLKPGMRSRWIDKNARYIALDRVSDSTYEGVYGEWYVRYSAGTGLEVDHVES